MDGSDNLMLILKSLTPIKSHYSKMNKELDIEFKNMSLKNLIKNLNCHYKVKDELSPSPEFLKNRNKFEISFRNSNKYIKELSNIKKSFIFANINNYKRSGSFKTNFVFNGNSRKEEKKIAGENENKEKEIFNERFKKIKILKKFNSNADSLKYNPNYDFIKKKVYCVHLSPLPSLINVGKNNKYNGKNVNYINKKNKSPFITKNNQK